MIIMTKMTRHQQGFTLIEIAMVLMIVALVLGGLLPTISSQIEQKQINDTRRQLAEIQQALIGFAIINGRLPCPMPSTVTNPTAPKYGVEASSCSSAPTAEGYLPWKTLNIPEIDSWGTKRTSSSSPWSGYWRYRPDRNFTSAFSLSTGFAADKLSVVDNNGSLLTSAPSGCKSSNPTTECPVAIVFSTGPDLTPDGKNSDFLATNDIYQSDVPTANFDDILIWISRPQLFNRMVTAGQLP